MISSVLFCSTEMFADNYKSSYKFSTLNKCVMRDDLNLKLNPHAKPFTPLTPNARMGVKMSSFNLFCYLSSIGLYMSICATFNPIRSIHDNYECNHDDNDPYKTLKSIRLSNVDRLIIGQLNINSLRNKFEALKLIVKGNLDILIITESKLDETFPVNQFVIDGFSPPFRADHNKYAGGVIIYVRDDIPSRELKTHPHATNFEGIFFEINLKKSKWLVFGGYNPHKDYISNFLNTLGPCLDHYMSRYDNFLLLGDFNSEMNENIMKTFCETFDLCNLIKEPTCFKSVLNPSTIDLILTNRKGRFHNSLAIETGLSDHHKLTITVMKSYFKKQIPITISYRDYKNFNQGLFRGELLSELYNINNGNINYSNFEKIIVRLLNHHAPLKKRLVRGNNSPFMNKTLSKAVMNRSRLRNKFIKNPSLENKVTYTRYRNYCTGLFRKEIKSFYNNLDTKFVTDNRKFWKTVKPLFSDKHFSNNKITLLEGEEIISNDNEIAEIFNAYFANIVDNLNVKGFVTSDYSYAPELDNIMNIVEKFKNHPSISKIKKIVKIDQPFSFLPVSESVICDKIESLDKRKPTTHNNIPTRILVENKDIISPFITEMYNESNRTSNFPNSLKLADVTPVHKKKERIIKGNYRNVSILPPVSKIYERDMFDQISVYIDKYLSPFLCGFRKGYSTQHCLMVMLDKWHKAIDSGKFAGALLTDLSKAFDCLNHELLIAKLEAYGFDLSSLSYIYSYLSDRKQRTKVNNSYSSWSGIKSGVPQGSILGPLLFNIYLNDIFYFVSKCDITNYADDTTPYSIDKTVDALLSTLEAESNILIKWFYDNYFQINADKCHLIISKRSKDVFINIEEEGIECSSSVKLLGITIDNKLNFDEHVNKLCKKASQKIHALARISNFMSQEKLRIIMKAFIESQFGYCPLVWMFHSRTLNNRINKLHERALRLVYKDTNLTFEELLRKDNSFTIHQMNLQKLATEMYKVRNDLSPTIMKSIFPERSIPFNLRNKNPFMATNISSVFNGTETVSFRGPKIWLLVPEEIRNSKTLIEFKARIKTWEPKGCTCRLCRAYVDNLGFI